MTDTQLQIRNRVARLAKAKKQTSKSRPRPVLRAQDVTIPEKEKSQFFGVFLTTCIILLFVATLGMLFMQEGGFDRFTNVASVEQEPVVEQNREVPPQTQPQPQPQPRLDPRVTKLEKDMDVFKHRVWLLGIATNENSYHAEQMDKAHHRVNERGFVKFDKDWKLNRVPKSMSLTPDQIERLNGIPKSVAIPEKSSPLPPMPTVPK